MPDTAPTTPPPAEDVDTKVKRLVKEALGEYAADAARTRTEAEENAPKSFLQKLFGDS